MPMVPELPVTMLACARLGVIHSQVFSGFSGKATADRIVDSESRVLITMDAYHRGGQLLDHKEKADIAFDEAKKDGVTWPISAGSPAIPISSTGRSRSVPHHALADLFARLVAGLERNIEVRDFALDLISGRDDRRDMGLPTFD